MSKAVIWDLDGTLLDSYDVIVESLSQALLEEGIRIPLSQIHEHTIRFFIKSLITELAEDEVQLERLQKRYSQLSSGKYQQIKTMAHGEETLKLLTGQGVHNYVFTHRGKTTLPVLENLGLKNYFLDIITNIDDFPRKPNPDAIHYLINKYRLEPCQTCYVGDRNLDMACARNAGIQGILYLPDGSFDVSDGTESAVIHDLLGLPALL